jgi:hypothetical protein
VRRLKKLASGVKDEGAMGEEQYDPGNGDKEALVDRLPLQSHQQDGEEVEEASVWHGG